MDDSTFMKTTIRWIALVLLSLILIGGVVWAAIGPDWRAFLSDLPDNKNVLFWSQSQRDVGFKIIDQSVLLADSNAIKASHTPRELSVGMGIELAVDMDAFFNEQRLSGALILHEGKIRYERYALGHGEGLRWTSFSVAKSFTSTLVGIALKEGDIKSLNDTVSTYIQGLKGSVYDQVTIEQLLTMTSGVEWNESYTDPNSDVAKFNFVKAESGVPNIVAYMRNLKRAHAPGEHWHYSTGETNLIGILIEEASGRTLAEYLEEKIWQAFGMANKATWLLGPDGKEISGCCLQASLRDFARFGLFVLEDGKINGQSLVPDNWFKKATSKRADIGVKGRGYGYQWWTFDDGSFTARGIFGQTLFIDPLRDLVIAFNGNWPVASDTHLNNKRFEFIDMVRARIDSESTTKITKEKSLTILGDLKNYQVNTPSMVSAGLPTLAHMQALKANGVVNVIDLIPGDRKQHAELMQSLNLNYHNIAVEWENPTLENFESYVLAMQQAKAIGGTTLTHCKLNWRGAVFTYLYRVTQLNESEESAKQDLMAIWEPNEIWQEFINETKAKYAQP